MNLNLKLNPGGAILAILGLALAIALIILMTKDSKDPPPKGVFVLAVFAAAGGGWLGNLLWKKRFPPRP